MPANTNAHIDNDVTARAVAICAANLPALRAYKPNPRFVAAEIKEYLDAKGWTAVIDWHWVGRNRHGCINVLNREGFVEYYALYSRKETRWDANDEMLTSCNSGSPKHDALLAVLKFLKRLPRRRKGA